MSRATLSHPTALECDRRDCERLYFSAPVVYPQRRMALPAPSGLLAALAKEQRQQAPAMRAAKAVACRAGHKPCDTAYNRRGVSP